jgi:hypothetical protein
MALSKINQKKANKAKSISNKLLLLQGKPFLYPRYLDIHRQPVMCHLREDETIQPDPKSCFITSPGYGSTDNCSANATGHVWLILIKRWLTKEIKIRVPFHELDFDITVDKFGYAYKEIDGEKVKCEYKSMFEI